MNNDIAIPGAVLDNLEIFTDQELRVLLLTIEPYFKNTFAGVIDLSTRTGIDLDALEPLAKSVSSKVKAIRESVEDAEREI